MNLFQNVKYGVSCREAAERYGVSVNRQGKALCPFHNDRHPSLYVADNHYFCFACGAHGDVIDFAADFFDLPLYEAAQRLAADFGIDTDRPPTKKILEKRRQQTEAQQLTENERLCFSVLSDYARVLREWKLRYAPQSSDETVHARFTEACHKLDETEYYLDILCAGNSHERAEVVQQQMADGKLDRLQRRLEEIHKEELEDGYGTPYALGEISKEKYKKMTADYEAEQERLKLEIETTEEWVEQRQTMGDDLDAFIALTKKYVDVTELTQTIVNEYIKKIIIHAPDKSGGKRRQKVEIIFNFVDEVEIPVLAEPMIAESTLRYH